MTMFLTIDLMYATTRILHAFKLCEFQAPRACAKGNSSPKGNRPKIESGCPGFCHHGEGSSCSFQAIFDFPPCLEMMISWTNILLGWVVS